MRASPGRQARAARSLTGEPCRRWPSTPMSRTTNCRPLSRSTTSARCLSCKGIAEGVENSNYPGHDRDRQFHPDALRKTGGARRSAVLYRADGASGEERSCLPDTVARPRRCRIARAVRPAGGDGDVSRRACGRGASSRFTAPRSAGHWRRCTRPARRSRMRRTNDLSVAGWRRLYEACAARAGEVQPGLADELASELARSKRLAAPPCRPGSSMPICFRTTCFFAIANSPG